MGRSSQAEEGFVVIVIYGRGRLALQPANGVNITRIILSALLFSLSAGIISTLAAFALSRFKAVTAVGYGIGGAAVHNLVQITVAALIFGKGVLYYLPFMLIASLFCGGLTGGTVLYLSRRNIPNLLFK